MNYAELKDYKYPECVGKAHEGSVRALVFVEEHTLLVSASEDRSISIHDDSKVNGMGWDKTHIGFRTTESSVEYAAISMTQNDRKASHRIDPVVSLMVAFIDARSIECDSRGLFPRTIVETLDTARNPDRKPPEFSAKSK